MFEIRKYTADKKEEWNKFVNKAKNSTFLFDRNYMDYHSDRFNDNSLMFYKKGKLYALLPSHKIDNILYSHFGLT
ncbi:MAG: GNAT family N-acetyltransferase, partial [Prevotella sp.]